MPEIDADARVIENVHTWDILEPAEAKYRPRKVSDLDHPDMQFGEVDGRRGPPALTVEAGDDGDECAQESRRRIGTPHRSRLLEDVGARLARMDALGIDIQVLHNTLFLYDMTGDPDAAAAPTRSWNRWLGETREMSDGPLLRSCLVPTRLLDEAKVRMRWARTNGAVCIATRGRGNRPCERFDNSGPERPFAFDGHAPPPRRKIHANRGISGSRARSNGRSGEGRRRAPRRRNDLQGGTDR